MGLARTSAIHTVLLVGTIPAFTYAAGVALGQERASARKTAGIALAFAGLAVLLAAGEAGARAEPGRGASVLGDVLVTLNCVSYSFYLIVARPLTRRYDPLSVVAWVFTAGAIMFLPIGAGALLALPWREVSWRAWSALGWIIAFPTVGAYWLSSWGLRRAEASLVAIYVLVQPMITTVLAIPLLGELPGWPAAVAAAAIFGGITVVARTPGPAR